MNDIEILEDFIEGKIEPDKLENYKGGYKMGFFYTKDLQKAIENLIQRNKDLKQIEKDHKEENGRLREKVKKIEEYVKQCDWHNNDVYIGEDILDLLEESD